MGRSLLSRIKRNKLRSLVRETCLYLLGAAHMKDINQRRTKFKLFLSHEHTQTEDEIKYLDHFHTDDPHDDCTHWLRKI